MEYQPRGSAGSSCLLSSMGEPMLPIWQEYHSYVLATVFHKANNLDHWDLRVLYFNLWLQPGKTGE